MKDYRRLNVQIATDNNGKIKAVVKENTENPVQAALDKLREERGVEQIRAQMTVGEKKLASIPLSLLNIDERYQRTENFSLSRAEKIARNFKEDYCGVITVFYRNGKFWVSDGMHRVMARVLRGDKEIVASIISGDAVEDGYVHEVMTFVEQATNTRRPSAYDRLKALASIDQSPAKEIMEISSKHGVSIVPKTTKAINGCISCVRLVETLVNHFGKEHFDELLEFICECGWNEQGGLTDVWISSLSVMIRRIDQGYDSLKAEAIKEKIKNIFKQEPPVLVFSKAVTIYSDYGLKGAISKYLKDLIKECAED